MRAMTLALLVAILAACGGGASDESVTTASVAASSTTLATSAVLVSSTTRASPTTTSAIAVPTSTTAVATPATATRPALTPTLANPLVALPPAGQLAAAISIGADPPIALATNEFVWVVSTSLDVIDPAQDRLVKSLPGGILPQSVALGFNSAWLVEADLNARNAAGGVVRLDAVTYDLQASIELPGLPVSEPTLVAIDASGVWVMDSALPMVWRVDPATNRVVATIELRRQTDSITVGGGAIWVGYAFRPDGEVARIDPATNEVVASVATGRTAGPIVYDDGRLWVLGYDDGTPVLRCVNAETGAEEAQLPLPGDGKSLVLDGRTLWVGTSNRSPSGAENAAWRNALVAVDVAQARIVAATELDLIPEGLAAGAGALWVLSTTDSQLRRFEPAR